LVRLVEWLRAQGFTHLDAQFQTPHLAQFGFAEMTRADYEELLEKTVSQ
jgi:leucyl/phenylalanyl-tRNA--protein transferase